MIKANKNVETMALCYGGVMLPYTISIDGSVYDSDGNEVPVNYNPRLGYRAHITLSGRTKSISLPRAILESFKGTVGDVKEIVLVYVDGSNRNIDIDNLAWKYKAINTKRSRSRMYAYDRTSMETALRVLSDKNGTVESAIRQSRLTIDQMKEIVTSSTYRVVRTGYNVKLCKEKLFGYYY